MASLDALLRDPRYEVFPAKGTEQAVLDWVPRGMTVTVTAYGLLVSAVREIVPVIWPVWVLMLKPGGKLLLAL